MRASEAASFLGGSLHGRDVDIHGVSSVYDPRHGTVVFVKSPGPADIARLESTDDVLVLVPPGSVSSKALSFIEVVNPRLSYARVVWEFFAERPAPGIAPSAVISPDAAVASDVSIGEFTVVGPGVTIGPRTVIRHHVTLGGAATIGNACLIKSHAVIGEEGFGFEFEEGGSPLRIPHLGSVRIGDRVEIGSLSTVMRGTIDDTSIEDRVKIDDHVTIGHNVHIGHDTLVIAGSVLSGSVRLGARVWVAPQVTVLNGLEVGHDTEIAIGSVVVKSVPPGVLVAGNPARVVRARG